MKTPEELLKEKRITPETAHHNYAYVYRAVCEVIGEAQKEAYNQAIDDAVNSVKVVNTKKLNFETGRWENVPLIDQTSILKLKK